MTTVKVAVQAADPLSLAGLVSYLRESPDIEVLPGGPSDAAEVVVAGVEQVDPNTINSLRRAIALSRTPVVAVCGHADDAFSLYANVARLVVLPAADASDGRLVKVVLAVARDQSVGEFTAPEHPEHAAATGPAKRAQPSAGQSTSPFTEREIDVLRLLADGHGTAEVASNLGYSQRTVKNVIYNLTRRLDLKNRQHAVAYAFRAGILS